MSVNFSQICNTDRDVKAGTGMVSALHSRTFSGDGVQWSEDGVQWSGMVYSGVGHLSMEKAL